MQVRFGNLSVAQFENRIGQKLDIEDYDWLEEHRQSSAHNIAKDKLHIFDLPFQIIVGSEISGELTEMLQKYYDKKSFKESLQILESEE